MESYRLTSSTLEEDTLDEYRHTRFEFVSLPNSDYEKVSHLLNDVPGSLYNESAGTMGCPDCADQGGYYPKLQGNGADWVFRIDKNKDVVPAYLHDFLDDVEEAINELSD